MTGQSSSAAFYFQILPIITKIQAQVITAEHHQEPTAVKNWLLFVKVMSIFIITIEVEGERMRVGLVSISYRLRVISATLRS